MTKTKRSQRLEVVTRASAAKDLKMQGRSTKDIAAILGVRRQTVDRYFRDARYGRPIRDPAPISWIKPAHPSVEEAFERSPC